MDSNLILLENRIQNIISKYLPEHSFKEVLNYSLFPAGKLFRSSLIIAFGKDTCHLNDDFYQYAAAVESHHTYTLIHDDLPCMDNDDFRRGRESSHKKFNEALATLAGDSLLNLSYELIANLKSRNSLNLLKTFSSLLGPKGLILGQVLDLEGAPKTFRDLLKIHSLKTSNLISASLLGANILSENKFDSKKVNALGYHMGIAFQLLDDLLEFKGTLSKREKEINPFIRFDKQVIFEQIKESNFEIHKLLNELKVFNTKEIIDTYFDKQNKELNSFKEIIIKELNILDIPIFRFGD